MAPSDGSIRFGDFDKFAFDGQPVQEPSNPADFETPAALKPWQSTAAVGLDATADSDQSGTKPRKRRRLKRRPKQREHQDDADQDISDLVEPSTKRQRAAKQKPVREWQPPINEVGLGRGGRRALRHSDSSNKPKLIHKKHKRSAAGKHTLHTEC